MRSLIHFHHAMSPAALALDAAHFVAGHLRAALLERPQALLVVSGGSTPVPFFEALCGAHLDWSRITVTLADERWLPPDHAHSNERLVRQHLLRDQARAACFAPLYNGAATPSQGQAQAQRTLAALPWPADVMVLGIGHDGHTASLFPHAPELLASVGVAPSHQAGGPYEALCEAVPAPSEPNVPVARLSLTPHALFQTRQWLVHVTGQAKLDVLMRAQQAGPVAELPIRLVLQQTHIPCAVFHSP